MDPVVIGDEAQGASGSVHASLIEWRSCEAISYPPPHRPARSFRGDVDYYKDEHVAQ